jgi:plasmid stabilization system protein ParE
MSDFLIAPVARMELDEIWEYYAIELQNPDAADRIRDEIFAAFDTLAQTPGMGHFRSDLAKEPLRFWHVRGYPSSIEAKSALSKSRAFSTERETCKPFLPGKKSARSRESK